MTTNRSAIKVEMVQDARGILGEGPVWDERSRRLHWVDIHAGIVHRYSPADGSDRALNIGQPVSAVGLGVHGGMVLATQDGFGLVRTDSDSVDDLVEVEKELAGNRMNDGRCDPAGRFWAGTMASDWEANHYAGALYRLEEVEEALVATKVLTGLTVANGIDWAPDGRHMYYVDSWTQRVDCFEFDADAGTLGKRRTFVTIPPKDGLPDGLVVDSDGCVWVALFGAGRLRRYSPSAKVDLEIQLPVTLVTSATFGGSDLGDLYMTTAKHRLTADERDSQVHAGSVFGCRPGPTGKPQYRFSWV